MKNKLTDYKFKYYHLIIAVNKEYQKINPDIKVGLAVGRKDKHPYDVHITDLKTGKDYPSAYSLRYLGRLPSNIKGEKLYDWLKEKAKQSPVSLKSKGDE